MKSRLAQLSLTLALALGVATGAHAQALQGGKRDQAVLPVWNQSSGKIEALLLLEPANPGAASGFGDNALDAAFGIDAGNSLGVFCDRQSGLASALGNLANNCMLASFEDDGGTHASGTAAFKAGRNTRLGLSAGSGSGTLPAWLTPGSRGAGATVDLNDLTVFAQHNIGREGVVAIAGTVAKATLMTPAEATNLGIGDAWTSHTLSIGGGYGRFGASIVGQVVETPGQPKWEGLGLGLTWRTPWSGQLTVGADNLVTKGRNPFAPSLNGRNDEGTVPYIRYEQDL
ncbi:XOO1806 family protein [Luteimonas terricola]|uniref:Secreted protein n=1 Tax=Luteimonas terricola TaxID=645597 RepID=A0ABQ2EHA1_9GAMM|nr:hypothetical protein [Luteimonas terricola]GGK12394.1 hypothetical protein GCM10011394_22050 [Luteimonas terricola]